MSGGVLATDNIGILSALIWSLATKGLSKENLSLSLLKAFQRKTFTSLAEGLSKENLKRAFSGKLCFGLKDIRPLRHLSEILRCWKLCTRTSCAFKERQHSKSRVSEDMEFVFFWRKRWPKTHFF